MGYNCYLRGAFLLALFSAMRSMAFLSSPVPPGWEDMCTATGKLPVSSIYVSSIQNADLVFHMQCSVSRRARVKWQFQILRQWLRQLKNVQVFVQITCDNEGQISLPWPMKAPGLIGLTVTDCFLTERYADYQNPDISKIPDQLRILDIRNSVWLSDDSELEMVSSPSGLANLTPDYNCGQDDSIESFVNSNVSDRLTFKPVTTTDLLDNRDHLLDESKENNYTIGGVNNNGTLTPDSKKSSFPIESNSSSTAEEEFVDLLNRIQALDITCVYKRLKVLDESFPQVLPLAHFSLLVKEGKYPELRVLNYSASGITDMPPELSDSRKNFPKLKYLDLSRNRITRVTLINRPSSGDTGKLIVDLRSNNITSISLEDVTSWAELDGVRINIWGNPIHCDCKAEQLGHALARRELSRKVLTMYDYIRHLECASPPHLKGRKLKNLSVCAATTNYVQ